MTIPRACAGVGAPSGVMVILSVLCARPNSARRSGNAMGSPIPPIRGIQPKATAEGTGRRGARTLRRLRREIGKVQPVPDKWDAEFWTNIVKLVSKLAVVAMVAIGG